MKVDDAWWDHLAYELGMFLDLAKSYFDDAATSDVAASNLRLEAFLIHARVLDDFFANRGTKPDDDLYASHFVAGYERSAPGIDGEDRKRINKHVAHLSRSRLDGYVWPVSVIAKVVIAQIVEFANALSSEHRSGQFDFVLTAHAELLALQTEATISDEFITGGES